MATIPKEQLKKEIAGILKNADLSTTTAKKVRSELEEKLSVDLAKQKKVVDELVMEYLSEQEKTSKKKKNDDDDDNEDDDGGEEDESAESEEESKKKPAKRRAPPAKKAASDSDEDASDKDGPSDDDYKPKKAKKSTAKKGGRGGRKKKGSDSDSDEDWAKKSTAKRGGGGAGKGYTKPCKLSKELAELLDAEEMPRHEVVKRIWALIKERNLYDPKNKQFAICDDELFNIVGEKRFRIFGMMKYLKKHIF